MFKKKKEKIKRDKSVFREYFELIAETAIFLFFVMTFVVQASQIPTPSMENTILVGDFVLINKLAYARTLSAFERFVLPRKSIEKQDLVVFRSLEEPEKDVVKRVIAVSGDKLEIRDKQVFVNDNPLAEDYKIHHDSRVLDKDRYYAQDYVRDNFGPVVVNPGHSFVMGDNRDNSYDSRWWGELPNDRIKGRPWVIYFSYAAEEDSHLKTSARERLKKLVSYLPKARWRRIFRLVH